MIARLLSPCWPVLILPEAAHFLRQAKSRLSQKIGLHEKPKAA
jgi:hypothetical protein